MFGWLGKKSRSTSEVAADQLVETLKSFNVEKKETGDLFLSQVGVLHANFLGKFGSLEHFKTLPDNEKHQYFEGSLTIDNPILREVPAIKLAYSFYSCLTYLEDAGDRSAATKLRAEFQAIRRLKT